MAKMKIEIWSDVMCPFCYIGKRYFEAALSQFDHREEVEVQWKSFQLDSSIPEVSQDSYVGYLAKKRGVSEEQAKEMLGQVEAMAKEAGLDYHLSQAVISNSFNAHRLIQLAKENGKEDELEEHLFKAFFTEGKDIANKEVLLQLAKESGLQIEDVSTAFTDDKYAYEVKNDIQEAREIGVTGVPFFVMDRKYAVSGAQQPSHILDTIEKTYAEWSKNKQKPSLEVSNGASCDIDGNC